MFHLWSQPSLYHISPTRTALTKTLVIIKYDSSINIYNIMIIMIQNIAIYNIMIIMIQDINICNIMIIMIWNIDIYNIIIIIIKTLLSTILWYSWYKI